MASDILSKLGGDIAAAPQRSRSYALWIKIGLFAILMWILFGAVLIDMARDWWNEPAWSQGMLLPPLALYVAWLNRGQTLALPVAPDRRWPHRNRRRLPDVSSRESSLLSFS